MKEPFVKNETHLDCELLCAREPLQLIMVKTDDYSPLRKPHCEVVDSPLPYHSLQESKLIIGRGNAIKLMMSGNCSK